MSKRVLLSIVVLVLVVTGLTLATRSRTTTPDDPIVTLAAPVSTRTLAQPAVAVVHVAPNGLASNDGSAERPRDLASALSAHSPANPGDVILLHGGTYTGHFISDLRGAESAPIVVRGQPGERAIITAATATAPALTVNGLYTWFADLEITSAMPERTTDLVQNVPIRQGVGVLVGAASYLKFINLVVHDLQGGFNIPPEAQGIEIYGNVVYYNGWQRADGVGEGHGVLSPNLTDGRYIRDNIIFAQFSHGIQVYGSGVDNVLIEGNTVFNNGGIAKFLDRNIMVGGGSKNLVVAGNMTYFTAGSTALGEGVNIGFGSDCIATKISDNYFTGANPLNLTKCRPAEMRGNTIHGRFDPDEAKRHAENNDYMTPKPPPTPTMSGLKVFVRPNQYEPGRANITVFNWDRLPTVSIDVAAAQLKRGDEYVIHNAADFYGPAVLEGTYDEGPLTIPMRNLTVARPLGTVTTMPVSTAPEFGVFVLINKTRAGRTSTR